MKSAMKPVLITSVFLAALATAPLVSSHGKHEEGAPLVPSSDSQMEPMMNEASMHDNMDGMPGMMNQGHNNKNMTERHEMMQQHMGRMQSMMGNMEGMMSDNMSDSMTIEQRQTMISKHLDMMHNTMEQMMKQMSVIMGTEK